MIAATTVIAVSLAISISAGGWHPIIGSAIGGASARLAASVFFLAITKLVLERRALRLASVTICVSAIFWVAWLLVVATGDYRITVPAYIVLTNEIVTNFAIAGVVLLVEGLLYREGYSDSGD